MGTPWSVSALLEMLQNQGKWDQMGCKLIHQRSTQQHQARNSKVNPHPCSCAVPEVLDPHPSLLSLEDAPQEGASESAGAVLDSLIVLFIQMKTQDRMGLLSYS